MKYRAVPKFLHEVFGEKQSLIEIICTLKFAFFGSFLTYFVLYRHTIDEITWATVLGFILIADVLAGCIANFSVGTNKYYAQRPKGRFHCCLQHFGGEPLSGKSLKWQKPMKMKLFEHDTLEKCSFLKV